MLHGLFGFARYGDSATRPGARRTGGGNLRSAYDEDEESGGLIDDGDIGGDESAKEVCRRRRSRRYLAIAPRDIDQGAWRSAASSQGGVLAASALTTEDFPSRWRADTINRGPRPRLIRNVVRPYAIDAHEGMSGGRRKCATSRSRCTWRGRRRRTRRPRPSLGLGKCSCARRRGAVPRARALIEAAAATSIGFYEQARRRAREKARTG